MGGNRRIVGNGSMSHTFTHNTGAGREEKLPGRLADAREAFSQSRETELELQSEHLASAGSRDELGQCTIYSPDTVRTR